MLVDLAAEAFAGDIRCAFGFIGAAGMINRRMARKRFIEQFVGLVDAVCHFRDDDGLAVEAGHGHILVCGDDDCVRGGDFLRRQDILSAARTVRFDLDGDAALFRVLFKTFCGHEGMSDARRAGCDRKDPGRTGGLFSAVGGRSREAAVLLVVDELQERFLAAGGDQGFLEIRIHDHGGKFGKDGQMLVVGRIRRGDHKEQAARLAVHGLKVHAGRNGHSRESGSADSGAFCMRRGDAVAESGRTGVLTGHNVLEVLFLVGQIAAGFHEIGELTDRSGFVSRRGAKDDAVAFEQIGNTHIVLPFLLDKVYG